MNLSCLQPWVDLLFATLNPHPIPPPKMFMKAQDFLKTITEFQEQDGTLAGHLRIQAGEEMYF